ncbi:MAG: hypothetical protein Q3994_00930 [Prevotella sp.]|nr:hypothetical protein [Prevotella sp.]
MKKLFFAIVAMIFCLNISAQGFGQMPQPEEIAKMQAENMKQNYGIDDKQYDAVYKLYLKDVKEMMKEFQNMQGGDMNEMMGKVQARMEAMKKSLKEILTEEQFKKYEEDLKNNPFGGGAPGGF